MCFYVFFFFFKQKTADETRISDWSSDVCSSDLRGERAAEPTGRPDRPLPTRTLARRQPAIQHAGDVGIGARGAEPEHEARARKLPEIPAQGGDRGEERPPDGDPRQLPAIPVAITQRARRHLEHGISAQDRKSTRLNS